MRIKTMDKNQNSKVHTIKTLLDSGASVTTISNKVLYKLHRILKDKRINDLLYGRDL